MGTNYYTTQKHCEHCKRYDTDLHIGKASYGWCFSFRGYPHMRLTSWSAWKEYLKDKIIINEYGDNVSYEAFVTLIELRKAPNSPGSVRHHNTEGKEKGWFNPEYDWDDDQGYPFGSREFS